MGDEEELTTGQRIIGGVGGFSILAAFAALWWMYEPEPKDPCQDLRDYFAKVHDGEDINRALGQSAKIVVIDTPESERGVPCGLELVPISS